MKFLAIILTIIFAIARIMGFITWSWWLGAQPSTYLLCRLAVSLINFYNHSPNYELSKKGNTGGKYEGFVNSW